MVAKLGEHKVIKCFFEVVIWWKFDHNPLPDNTLLSNDDTVLLLMVKKGGLISCLGKTSAHGIQIASLYVKVIGD